MLASSDDDKREMLRQIRRIQVRTDRMVTDVMAGGYSSVFRGSGIEFDEVREFADGDDIRSVDWNVTARTGRPHVKKFMEERELSVLMLLDVSPSADFGTDPQVAKVATPATASNERLRARSVRETAALVSGCIAFAAARNNDKAGMITFTDRVERYVPAKKGRRHVLRLIREAWAQERIGNGTDLAAVLQFASRIQRKRAVVFLISDFFAAVPERELRLLSRRHDVIAVRIRDTHSETLPKAGLLRLRDPETGRAVWVDTSSSRVQQALVQRVKQDRTAFEDACRRAGIDHFDVATRGSVADPIVRFFRMRERRGGHR
ncbi:MAG: DUF58 domain-containing protein [Planctomycetota bacterium]|jgi:uncharacterized protein (DUF58 family)